MKYSLLCILLSSFAANATILDAPFEIFKSTKEYGKDTKIGFELKNKSSNPIWIALKSGGEVTGKIGHVPPGQTHRYTLDDLNKDTELVVWESRPPKTIEVSKKWIIAGSDVFDPKPDKIFTFTKGKTLYVTWDKDKFPRPQTGLLKGILGKTDSGLSLKNNLQSSDVKQKKS